MVLLINEEYYTFFFPFVLTIAFEDLHMFNQQWEHCGSSGRMHIATKLERKVLFRIILYPVSFFFSEGCFVSMVCFTIRFLFMILLLLACEDRWEMLTCFAYQQMKCWFFGFKIVSFYVFTEVGYCDN